MKFELSGFFLEKFFLEILEIFGIFLENYLDFLEKCL